MLLPDDLECLHGALEQGFARFPEVADAGIKRVVDGPFTFSPDGNPLVGPAPGLSNYWVACGVMAGFAQGGGIGLTLAHRCRNCLFVIYIMKQGKIISRITRSCRL